MVLPVIMALAKLAPSVAGLLTRNKTTTQAAQMVSQVARAVTGESNDDMALIALQKNPEKLAEYKIKINEHIVTMYELETERMEIANNAIHLEHTNKYGFIRNVRPLFGYCIIYMIFTTFTSVTYTILFKSPKEGVEVIKAFSMMQWIFVAGFSAIGVYIQARTKDKNPNTLGVLGALVKRLGK